MNEIDPKRKAARMAEDKAFIEDLTRWPDDVLHMKTQPWVEPQSFGFITADAPLSVRIKTMNMSSGIFGIDGQVEHFHDMDSMVERWTVD